MKPYKVKRIRCHTTTGISKNIAEKSFLLYIGKRPTVVIGIHRKTSSFSKEWWFEFTRYPKSKKEK